MQTKKIRRPISQKRKRRLRLVAGIALLFAVLCIGIVVIAGLSNDNGGGIINEDEASNEWQYVLPTQPPFVIAMDAGHGGNDVGATGVITELELTEYVVYYLNGWLKNDDNYTPIYTRPDGEGATLAQRVEAANNANADLMISIHGNSQPGSDTAKGFEVYPTPPGRQYYEPSLRFAKLIAKGMGNAGALLRGNAGVRYCYYTEGEDNEYSKEIVEENNTTVRTEQSFAVVEKVNCPSVLIEQCFVTNLEDVDTWGRAEGCAKAARIYYEAICEYFGTEPISAES